MLHLRGVDSGGGQCALGGRIPELDGVGSWGALACDRVDTFDGGRASFGDGLVPSFGPRPDTTCGAAAAGGSHASARGIRAADRVVTADGRHDIARRPGRA